MMIKQRQGAMLLEVLIAATILSVGVLACLRVFSAAIYASSKTVDSEHAEKALEQAMFESFLDPTLVDLETGARTIPKDVRTGFEARQESTLLSEKESEEEEVSDSSSGKTETAPKKTPSARWNFSAAPVEFFETALTFHRGAKTTYRFDEVVFRYGKKK